MSPFRGLRTNCILAPLAIAVLGAAAIVWAFGWHVEALAQADLRARTETVAALARQREADPGTDLASWLAARPGWTGVGDYRLEGDRLVAIAEAGAARAGTEPSNELVLAGRGARAWREGASGVAAAPSLPPGGRPSVVVAWWLPAPEPPPWPWFALAGAVLVAGGGLGWYLVARVYRPVLWLERAAQAAAAGAPEPPGRVDSVETESLRSSLAAIMGQQPAPGGTDGDAKP